MSEAAYTDWLDRGRQHQYRGRPLDAIQCFRRAAREWPAGAEAPFHMGEASWQMGQLDDALRAWREATRRRADFLPAWQALAEASLGLGDADSAHDAAAQLLERGPDDARVAAVAAIAGYMRQARAGGAASDAVIEALGRDPAWLAVPALGGSLALALERVPDAAVAAAVARGAAGAGPLASLHPRLHALLCERMAIADPGNDSWGAAMATRTLGVEHHDALRRAACAAAHAGLPSAATLAAHYATMCATAFRPALPLLWPLRTAGARPRVVLLARSRADAATCALVDRLATTADVLVAAIDADETVDDAGRAHATLVLSGQPAEDARRLAAFDADVLVDLCGLDASVGPLLGQRPARRVVTLADVPAPLPAPLVDARVSSLDVPSIGLVAGWVGPVATSAPVDVHTLDAVWRDAVAAHQRGDRVVAAAGYAQVLAWQPGHAPALYLQGMLARDDGDFEGAGRAFAAALALAPSYVDARIAALDAAGAARNRVAVEALAADIAVSAQPTLLRAAGLAWLAVREPQRAEAFFRAALEQGPADAETHYNLGVALQSQRRMEDAARSYQRALACNPDMVAADFNLGVIFTEAGNTAGAIRAFGEVLARDPRHVSAHQNLCEALHAAGRIDEWLAAFRRFERARPLALPLAVQALEACHAAGDVAGVERYLEGLRKEQFTAAGAVELADSLEQLLYLLLYFDVEPQMIRRFAETYSEVAAQVYGAPLPPRPARQPGRLRIGYLSADLRDHVMGKMMYQALRHHDRSRFDVRLYSMSPVQDEWTARFTAIADAFTSLAGVDDEAAVARLAADDLDLLVDLNTHTKGARPALLARKPARVQLTHVASAGTLAMRTIDFKLTDGYADVPENQDEHVETLLPMAGCVYPFRVIEAARSDRHTRAALGLPNDAIVIAAFVNPLKLSRRCLALWREVLGRVPRARLAFSPLDPALREVYRRVVAAAGIDAARIVFLPASGSEAQNQARYGVVDMVLDPLPFGGVNGTLEALLAGVPVVTLVGRRHGERTSYSILANLGVTQTLANSGRDYVELAVRLAEDRAFRASVQEAIARGLAGSVLTDMPAHTRNLEAAYLEALRQKMPQVLEALDATAAAR